MNPYLASLDCGTVCLHHIQGCRRICLGLHACHCGPLKDLHLFHGASPVHRANLGGNVPAAPAWTRLAQGMPWERIKDHQCRLSSDQLEPTCQLSCENPAARQITTSNSPVSRRTRIKVCNCVHSRSSSRICRECV
jgi:hypothetical protein